jgi:hypothetical protein
MSAPGEWVCVCGESDDGVPDELPPGWTRKILCPRCSEILKTKLSEDIPCRCERCGKAPTHTVVFNGKERLCEVCLIGELDKEN